MSTSPCEKQREAIAWMSAGALEPRDQAALQAHLETCSECREHAESMQQLCGQIRQATAPLQDGNGETPLPRQFHSRLQARIRADAAADRRAGDDDAAAQNSRPIFNRWVHRLFEPRVVLAAAAGLMLIGVAWWAPQHSGTPSPGIASVSSNNPPIAASPKHGQEPGRPSPVLSLMAMNRAMNESYEKLDAYLARQEDLLAANDPPSRTMGW